MYLWYLMVRIGLGIAQNKSLALSYIFAPLSFLKSFIMRFSKQLSATLSYSITYLSASWHLDHLNTISKNDLINGAYAAPVDSDLILHQSSIHIAALLTLRAQGFYVYTKLCFAGYSSIENPSITTKQGLQYTLHFTKEVRWRVSLIQPLIAGIVFLVANNRVYNYDGLAYTGLEEIQHYTMFGKSITCSRT